MIARMDVFFSDFGIKGATAAVIDIVKAWDDTFYAETNVKELCGPARMVDSGNRTRVATVDGRRLNCPARMC